MYTYDHIAGGNSIIGGVIFQNRYFWCDHYREEGGYFQGEDVIEIPCPEFVVGMAAHQDTLFCFDYLGRIYRWEELPVSLDTLEEDEPHETAREIAYRKWLEAQMEKYGIDPFMAPDGRITDGLPKVPGVYFSIIRQRMYIVTTN